jgi:hypothetical protein
MEVGGDGRVEPQPRVADFPSLAGFRQCRQFFGSRVCRRRSGRRPRPSNCGIGGGRCRSQRFRCWRSPGGRRERGGSAARPSP